MEINFRYLIFLLSLIMASCNEFQIVIHSVGYPGAGDLNWDVVFRNGGLEIDGKIIPLNTDELGHLSNALSELKKYKSFTIGQHVPDGRIRSVEIIDGFRKLRYQVFFLPEKIPESQALRLDAFNGLYELVTTLRAGASRRH